MRGAVGFLTTLPVGAGAPGRAALVGFPIVGAAIGVMWALAFIAGAELVGPTVGAAFVLVADLAITGGLHLDGLADTADGLASRTRGERLREVMADPRVGAVGAAVLGTALLARFALLASFDGPALLLVLAPTVARTAMVWTLVALPADARSLSHGLVSAARPPIAALALAICAVICVVAGTPILGVASTGAALVGYPIGVGWRVRTGGASGDVVGASGIVIETVTLTIVVAS